MAVKQLVLFPDPSLNTPSEPVVEFDDDLRRLIHNLRDTLYASPGVGLAAPQIGICRRVSVIDTSRFKRNSNPVDMSHGYTVLVNPRIIESSGTQTPREGCLSVPDLLANVKRRKNVTIRYFDQEGQEHEMKSSGFEALAIQHEIDHLDGKLFLDRVVNIKTDIFRRTTY